MYWSELQSALILSPKRASDPSMHIVAVASSLPGVLAKLTPKIAPSW
jgi:hypothetical protein